MGEFNVKYREKMNNILDHQLRKKLLQAVDFNYIQDSIENLPFAEPYLCQLKTIDGIMGLISDIQLNRSVGSYYIINSMKVVNLLLSLYPKK